MNQYQEAVTDVTTLKMEEDMLITNYQDVLRNIPLFKSFTSDDFKRFFKDIKYRIEEFSRNSMVFIEGETCNTLNIILDGNIRIQKIDPIGKSLVVVEFTKGDIIGETLLFGEDNKYPMTGISVEKSTILYIEKDAVLSLCQRDTNFLNEFFKLLSAKSVTLSNKLKEISLKTIRQKVSEFLVLEYERSKVEKIPLNMTKKEWADILGVQRPSLSRELIGMKKDGIIDYDYKYVYIKDIAALKNILYE